MMPSADYERFCRSFARSKSGKAARATLQKRLDQSKLHHGDILETRIAKACFLASRFEPASDHPTLQRQQMQAGIDELSDLTQALQKAIRYAKQHPDVFQWVAAQAVRDARKAGISIGFEDGESRAVAGLILPLLKSMKEMAKVMKDGPTAKQNEYGNLMVDVHFKDKARRASSYTMLLFEIAFYCRLHAPTDLHVWSVGMPFKVLPKTRTIDHELANQFAAATFPAQAVDTVTAKKNLTSLLKNNPSIRLMKWPHERDLFVTPD